MKTRVREHMANRKRRSVEAETKDRLFAALTERYQFPVPESLVQEQIDARLERGLRALAAQGMDPEQMRKLDFGRLRGAQRDSAVAEVKTNLLLDRIAEEETLRSATRNWTENCNWRHFSRGSRSKPSASV